MRSIDLSSFILHPFFYRKSCCVHDMKKVGYLESGTVVWALLLEEPHCMRLARCMLCNGTLHSTLIPSDDEHIHRTPMIGVH